MFSSTAEMRPPEVPPIYSPMSNERPCTGSILNVMGRNKATPMVTVMPGMDPNKIPSTVPPKIKNMIFTVKTDIIPATIIARLLPVGYPNIPLGIMT